MSKGSTIVNVRIPDDLLEQIERDIVSRNKVSKEEPWTMSAWLRYVIRVKLSHSKRNKAKGKNKGKARKQHQLEGV